MRFDHNVLYGDRLYRAGEDVPCPDEKKDVAPSQPVEVEAPKEEVKPVAKKSKAKK